jgi:hypothetical protein
MTEKKEIYEAEMLSLLPMRLVLGDLTVQDPDWRYKISQKRLKTDPEIESTVKRLIAHFKDEK